MSVTTLMDRAVRLLGIRSYSESELAGRLRRHGTREEVDSVIRQLKSLGYLDDTKVGLERAAVCRADKHWGKSRIACDLKSRGIDAKIIGLVLDQVSGEVPETESLRAAIDKYVDRKGKPVDLRGLKRLFDHCVRLGYSNGAVREALAPFFAELGGEE